MNNIETLQSFVDDWLENYDGDYLWRPSPNDRLMLADAIYGLIADDEFLRLVAQTRQE